MTTRNAPTDRRLSLVLALCEPSVSADSLIEWGVARPSELIAWLDVARKSGAVSEAEAGEPGRLVLSDDARVAALADATRDDFHDLARRPALVPELLGAARREASRRGTRMAAELYPAIFETVPPESFPGGPAGFVAALVESLRLYRSIYVVLGGALDRGIALATECGDLAAQARLLAAKALAVVHGVYPGDVAALLAQAREAGEAVGGDVRSDVLGYSAVSLVFSGRLREGIAAFEVLLGDVPEDALASLVDPGTATPGAATIILAVAYSQVGQHPRALELLHQLLALGQRMGNPDIVHEATLFLGLLHAMRGEHAAAAGFAEPAYAHFRSGRDNPGYGYFAGLALSLVRAADGRFADARAALEVAVDGWRRAGCPPVGNEVYEVYERLEATGEAPPSGFDPVAEAERAIRLPLPQCAGLGHRFLALRAARGATTDEELAAAAARLETAIELLREAGTVYDLARACTDAAALAERRGRADEARQWRAEAARAAPPASGNASPKDAAHLRAVVLDLGRLPLSGHGDGLWGRIAARLCEGFGAERCALVELAPEPRLLATRGGTREWQGEMITRATAAPTAPQVMPLADGEGQLVLVPFAAPDLDRRGFVALENLYAAPAVGAGDGALLEALGVQLGVLFGNVTLWQELARARERLEQENRYFRESAPSAAGARMVAHSPAMREVMALVGRVAPAATAVLITGETGVGKELVAHEIHRQSTRRDGPFIAVHIASLAPGLVASALFGHERGAFTGATEQAKGRFELADGGTLLLDEVGELSLEDQVKLLRVLQEGTFERVGGSRQLRSDFRLVAATNRDLAAEVAAGRFREDLYFRLNVFPIRVPPLRERREEIPTLALFFMERVARQRGDRFEGIGEADMRRLIDWDWPGNVRELAHVIERAALLSEPPRLRIPPLEGGLARALQPAAEVAPAGSPWVTLAEAERRYIRQVLQHVGGRVTGAGGAAEILGLKPSTLQFRIDKLGLRSDLAQARKAGLSRKS